MELFSVLTCPECGYDERLEMPADACLFFHECGGCHVRLKPKSGDCCVFYSYASVPCPPIRPGEAIAVRPARRKADDTEWEDQHTSRR